MTAQFKFYAIAAAFGDPETGRLETLVSGTWMGPNPETAAAQSISKYYVDGNKRLPVIGVSVTEIAQDAVAGALDRLRQANAAAEAVAPQVVPWSVVSVPEPIEHPDASPPPAPYPPEIAF